MGRLASRTQLVARSDSSLHFLQRSHRGRNCCIGPGLIPALGFRNWLAQVYGSYPYPKDLRTAYFLFSVGPKPPIRRARGVWRPACPSTPPMPRQHSGIAGTRQRKNRRTPQRKRGVSQGSSRLCPAFQRDRNHLTTKCHICDQNPLPQPIRAPRPTTPTPSIHMMAC